MKQENLESCQILIGLTDEAGLAVKRDIDRFMRERGAQVHCILYEEFMRNEFPAIVSYYYNKIFVHSLSLIITEQCTLKCKKCSIMLPYFRDIASYSLEELKQDVDLAFQKIDFIGDFTVTGGEPLLNCQLYKILAYIGQRYRKRIGSLKIITNGTLLPNKELLDVMAEYDVTVEISDYTRAVPGIKHRVDELKETLTRYGIIFHFLSTAQWVDFGFESEDKGLDESSLSAFFDYCSTKCRGYVKGEIWYCINAGFAEKALQKQVDEDNRLALGSIGESLDERRKIVEFDLGFNSKGYLELCRCCNGTCEINTNFIEVGEQWENL
ncbi:MAG: radical SAM protein [Clostridiaceae bacterium]|uniref:radical SAM protein n=1 Tax=Clostridium TaxID=1485 RepID=UPI00258EF38E|nr:radical SAM protein [Clostridium sp.]MCI6140811.1 radical SAM protein [Clostridium sp.]MDY3231337.1 radical SAM protein [Clostridiaceae bacterium]